MKFLVPLWEMDMCASKKTVNLEKMSPACQINDILMLFIDALNHLLQRSWSRQRKLDKSVDLRFRCIIFP